MTKDNLFMEYLKSACYYVSSEAELPKPNTFSKTTFTPKKMAAIVLHSMVSSKPRKNFYTDGRFIYYDKGSEINPDTTPLTEIQAEDILREDEVLKILRANPYDSAFLYGKKGDHLRLSDFSNCFNGAGQPNSPYQELIKSIESRLPADLIRQDEKNRIKSRLIDHKGRIEDLILSLHNAEYSNILQKVRAGLDKYKVS